MRKLFVLLFVLLGMFISAAAADSAKSYPLRKAVECRSRKGLPNVFSKLQQGREVRIAYLGGSITAQKGWRPMTLNWFQQQYPQAKVSEINAAIGGTGSNLGVFRLEHNVLRHRPDLLFVEFAVNDGATPPKRIQQAMEGILRQTWKADAMTDICYIYTLKAGGILEELQNGKFSYSASAMEELADYYGIPSIHMGLEVARLETEGKLLIKADGTEAEQAMAAGKIIFSKDGVHPNVKYGHKLYLEAVIRAMNRIKTKGTYGPHKVGKPLLDDNWESAKMLPLDRAQISSGWRKLDPSKDRLAKLFQEKVPSIWCADKPGETISFRFKGRVLKIYDVLGPDCGQIIVKVDDRPVRIRRRFDAYCTYHRLNSFTVVDDLTDSIHKVELEIHPEQPDKAKILAKRNLKIDDPARFDGVTWYVGGILLVGELL